MSYTRRECPSCKEVTKHLSGQEDANRVKYLCLSCGYGYEEIHYKDSVTRRPTTRDTEF
jgi:transposase-like protein